MDATADRGFDPHAFRLPTEACCEINTVGEMFLLKNWAVVSDMFYFHAYSGK